MVFIVRFLGILRLSRVSAKPFCGIRFLSELTFFPVGEKAVYINYTFFKNATRF